LLLCVNTVRNYPTTIKQLKCHFIHATSSEALRYVSFPTQTLGKCGKMIPVMIIGIFISGKKYGWQEFGIAGAVTTGCVAFVLSGVGNFLKYLGLLSPNAH